MKSIKNQDQSHFSSDSLTADRSGQSLVEFALIVPVLLIMLLGVFEVGFALRSYLALVNVNREATRFAARGIYLNFDETVDPYNVGYEKVVSHTLQSLAGQLPLDVLGTTPNGTQIITLYRVEPTSFACPGDASCANFDCSLFAYENRDEADFEPGETLHQITYPLLWTDNAGDPDLPDYYQNVLAIANTTPLSSYHYYRGANDIYSHIDPAEMVAELRSRSNVHNCELVKKQQPPTSSDYVVVENIYLQEPIVGLLPFIGDTVPMYSHTLMRVTSNIREANVEEEPVCELYPIMVPLSMVEGVKKGDPVVIPITNNHDAPGNFGFIHWKESVASGVGNPVSKPYQLPSNLENPGNAATDFEEPDSSPLDTQINVGDWVRAMTGANASVEPELKKLKGQYMRMPVWYDLDCDTGGGCSDAVGEGNNIKFRIQTFAIMKIIDVDLPKEINFQFIEFDPNTCVGDD